MQTRTPKFNAWLAVEKEAQQAERELHAAMLRFAEGQAAQPLEGTQQAARRKRAEAHALFTEAMQELKNLADSLHPPRPAAGTPAAPGRTPEEDAGQPASDARG